MKNKRVLITGITGQDGSYMAEYCLNLGHEVYGMVRRTSNINDQNFKHLYSNTNFNKIYGDLLDGSSLDSIVQEVKPDYFINFAAQSFVGVSWRIPEETFMAGAVGVLKCLEAVRKYAPSCRFYNAGSSEQFGDVIYSPQDEKHPFRPRSPYGAAKASAQFLVKVYRESYNIYAVQGILFNHESERRGEEFVTRKITKGVARIAKAIQNNQEFKPIELGNLMASRDWSHAEDFVDGVWKMLNQKETIPNLKEYVLASGETHTINEFIQLAFKHAGIKALLLNGTPLNSKVPYDPSLDMWCYEKTFGRYPALVVINPEFYRPNEVNLLMGDPSLAKKELNWNPKISFSDLVERMVKADLQK
jgi:GDPmannose 4,6-dehydratase